MFLYRVRRVKTIARSQRGRRQPENTQRINRRIRAREVRLIDQDGEQKGVLTLEQALGIANEAGLDLVEVSPNANPPVCRLMDYGKFLYEKSKRERIAKKAQVKTEVKEIRLRPKTGAHDIGFKLRDARKWLERGDKVKVRMRFRGREFQHMDVARNRMDEIAQQLKDVGVVEQRASMEGRSMLMILGPVKSRG